MIVVTRPAHQAKVWVDALQAAGHRVKLFPLLRIAPSTSALPAACPHLAELQHLMFVSPNAVQFFWAHLQRLGQTLAPQVRCWATGQGTVAALRAAGVAESQIDAPAIDAAQWDSEHLWQSVSKPDNPSRPQAGEHLLIVRGESKELGLHSAQAHSANTAPIGRDWLAQTARAAGLHVHEWVVYQRLCPTFSTDDLSWLESPAACESVWLFSSSEALAHLPHIRFAAAPRALCTHPRIAAAAKPWGFQTRLCQPSVASVLAALAAIKQPP